MPRGAHRELPGAAGVDRGLSRLAATSAYDRLLDELRATVIPNLQRFSHIARRYLDTPPQSAEALAQLRALPSGSVNDIRVYLHGDYLILHTVASPATVAHLLSIRHHRELSFQFAQLWPGSEHLARALIPNDLRATSIAMRISGRERVQHTAIACVLDPKLEPTSGQHDHAPMPTAFAHNGSFRPRTACRDRQL